MFNKLLRLPRVAVAFSCIALLLLSLSFLPQPFASWPQDYSFNKAFDALHTSKQHPANFSAPCVPVLSTPPDDWATSRFLKGPPTEKFRENLLDDVHYITTFLNAGFTNQFMMMVNMIYLAMLSERVPIIPPFVPDHHISNGAGALPFGQVFNLSRAREALRIPLLEWKDVKAIDPTSVATPPDSDREHLGCWSARPENEPRAVRTSSIMDNLGLDIAYTRLPQETRRERSDHRDNFIDFSHVVPFIYPNQPVHQSNYWPVMDSSPLGHSESPDEQLACFDQLYYLTSSNEIYEWRFSWSPAWRFVAKHLYFTDNMVDLAKSYLARAFKAPENDLPPFIAIHIRRGDFKRQCFDGRPQEQCVIPLSKFLKEVNGIRDELREKKNLEVDQVIVMSDETEQAFWDEVESLGWVQLDHVKEMTLEKHGEWIPPILDQVAQSLAVGFVGTYDSTFSLVSMRRIHDWHHGPALLIERDPYHP